MKIGFQLIHYVIEISIDIVYCSSLSRSLPYNLFNYDYGLWGIEVKVNCFVGFVTLSIRIDSMVSPMAMNAWL